ncbi:MAG: hypothetical protein NVS3B17_05730 [Vulcanimicrobiaceae bacterium]
MIALLSRVAALAIPLVAEFGSAASAEPTLGPGAIGATIRDANDRAIVGASVVADGPIAREAVTAAGGVVTLDALPLGSYVLRVVRAGFAPYAKRVTLGGSAAGIVVVDVRLVPDSFSSIASVASPARTLALADDVDPLAAHAIERSVDANVVAGPRGDVAIALAGTSARQSRVEIDGIPVAGGARSAAALRARSGLGYASVEVARGPVLATPSLRDAIGGIVDFRTADVDAPAAATVEGGYDSTIGRFEHVSANRHVGRVGLLADVVDGPSLRSQTLAADLTSRRLAFRFAYDAAQAKIADRTRSESVRAPSSAFDVRAAIGATTLTGRAYASASDVDADRDVVRAGGRTVALATRASVERARTRGVQVAYAVPLGEHSFSIGYDRRSSRDALPNGSELKQTDDTIVARADLRLTPVSRLEIGDAYARGTFAPPRHDPFVALALRADPHTTLRVGAGSAYATVPTDALGREAIARGFSQPETSFGVRLQLDETLVDGSRAWFALDDVRRFDRFARFARARSSGIEVGYARAPAVDRFDGTIAVRFERERASGVLQPVARASAGDEGGTPSYKARVTTGYSDAASAISLGITAIGPGNALASHAIALGDVHVRARIGRGIEVRAGLENAFGFVSADPNLARLFAPHEFTLSVGPARDR